MLNVGAKLWYRCRCKPVTNAGHLALPPSSSSHTTVHLLSKQAPVALCIANLHSPPAYMRGRARQQDRTTKCPMASVCPIYPQTAASLHHNSRAHIYVCCGGHSTSPTQARMLNQPLVPLIWCSLFLVCTLVCVCGCMGGRGLGLVQGPRKPGSSAVADLEHPAQPAQPVNQAVESHPSRLTNPCRASFFDRTIANRMKADYRRIPKAS